MFQENMLPALCAFDIQWDADGEVLKCLPKFVEYPTELVNSEELPDYVTNQVGFYHKGFTQGLLFRGKPVVCDFVQSGSNTYEFKFSVGNAAVLDSAYYKVTIRKSDSINVFVNWGLGDVDLERLVDAERYLSVQELLAIMRICDEIMNLADDVPEDLEIDRMLTISTTHISSSTASLLDDEVYSNTRRFKLSIPVYRKMEFGWFIYCGPEVDLRNCPDDLKAAIKYARKLKCVWLCLDADGEHTDELVDYGAEEETHVY